MRIKADKENVIVENVVDFDLEQTMECGQCFHFVRLSYNEYGISAFGRLLHIKQVGDTLTLYNVSLDDFDNIWKKYFDLDRDYNEIKTFLIREDSKLKEAVETMGGVRILNQEFFETLISFIISQNKQIGHIKKIVADISKKYGTYLGQIKGEEFYSFPTLSQIRGVTVEELRELKTGFRAPYICDAIEKVLEWNENGEYEKLYSSEANVCREKLIQIKGVGMKVANCAMLFGLSKRDSFPVDVWIKRIMQFLYFEGEETDNKVIEEFANKRFGKYGGYAQQYLFYYARSESIKK